MRSREKHYAKLCWFCKEYNGNQSLTSCHSIVLPARALPHCCGASWLPSHSLAVVGAWLCRIYPRWLHVWTCVHTWYLVTCSDISTVLHGTQGPWAVTPLSGWSSPGPSPFFHNFTKYPTAAVKATSFVLPHLTESASPESSDCELLPLKTQQLRWHNQHSLFCGYSGTWLSFLS